MKKLGKIIGLSIIILSLLIIWGEVLYLAVNLVLLKRVSYAWIDNNVIDFLLGAITIFSGLFVLSFLNSRKIRSVLWLIGLFCILGLGVESFLLVRVSEQPITELSKNKPFLDHCLQSEDDADQCYLNSVEKLIARQGVEKQYLLTEFHRRWFEYAKAYCELKVNTTEYGYCLYQETQRHLYWLQGLKYFVAGKGMFKSENKLHFSADAFIQQLILAVLAVFLIAFMIDRNLTPVVKLLVWPVVFVFLIFAAVALIDHQRMYGLSIGNEFGYLAFDEFKHGQCRDLNMIVQKECYKKLLPGQTREIEEKKRELSNETQRKNELKHFSNLWQKYTQSMCYLMDKVGKSEFNYCLYKENLIHLRFLETLAEKAR